MSNSRIRASIKAILVKVLVLQTTRYQGKMFAGVTDKAVLHI